MTEPAALRLFEGVGIEIEYMIVDARSLDVRPLAAELLRSQGELDEGEVELGDVAWSNELALHVIELKTNGPARDLRGLGALFQQHVDRADADLAERAARLMPTGMHPWMDPDRDLALWPYEGDAVYRTFDRIFGCRGHGWANLQSMHVNLPFADDDEFGRLHAATRLVLPVLPALAASSPLVDGRLAPALDMRMRAYRDNARRIPSVTGDLVPEPAFTRAEYRERVLDRIYRDLAPLDPERVLRHEWVNSRGCIARFDRNAIEIRVLDVQECPRADIAVAGATVAAVRGLVEERHAGQREQRAWHERALAELFDRSVDDGDRAVVRDADYLRMFGFPERAPARASELWQHVVETWAIEQPGFDEWAAALRVATQRGCLARRIRDAVGETPSRDAIRDVYRRLCDCLREGALFEPPAR